MRQKYQPRHQVHVFHHRRRLHKQSQSQLQRRSLSRSTKFSLSSRRSISRTQEWESVTQPVWQIAHAAPVSISMLNRGWTEAVWPTSRTESENCIDIGIHTKTRNRNRHWQHCLWESVTSYGASGRQPQCGASGRQWQRGRACACLHVQCSVWVRRFLHILDEKMTPVVVSWRKWFESFECWLQLVRQNCDCGTK